MREEPIHLLRTLQRHGRMSDSLFFFSLMIVHLVSAQLNTELTCDDMPGPKPPCKHKGKCSVGRKNYTAIPHLYPSFPLAPFWQNATHNDMYCTCKDEFDPDILPGDFGFTGLLCDVFYTVCSDWSVCFHGSHCAENSTNPGHYYCDCQFSYTAENWYAGRGCEYPGTEFCGVEIDDHGLYDLAWLWFCANDGICDHRMEDENKRCQCPDGFYGSHCEYPANPTDTISSISLSTNQSYSTLNARDKRSSHLVYMIMIIVATVATILYSRSRRTARSIQPKEYSPVLLSNTEPYSDNQLQPLSSEIITLRV